MDRQQFATPDDRPLRNAIEMLDAPQDHLPTSLRPCTCQEDGWWLLSLTAVIGAAYALWETSRLLAFPFRTLPG
jgi:hypothetical protein